MSIARVQELKVLLKVQEPIIRENDCRLEEEEDYYITRSYPLPETKTAGKISAKVSNKTLTKVQRTLQQGFDNTLVIFRRNQIKMFIPSFGLS